MLICIFMYSSRSFSSKKGRVPRKVVLTSTSTTWFILRGPSKTTLCLPPSRIINRLCLTCQLWSVCWREYSWIQAQRERVPRLGRYVYLRCGRGGLGAESCACSQLYLTTPCSPPPNLSVYCGICHSCSAQQLDKLPTLRALRDCAVIMLCSQITVKVELHCIQEDMS